MTQVVVARLIDLPQAQTLASALRSAGLHPMLLEETQASAYWPILYAIGGCRVAVPADEALDAQAILSAPFEPAADFEPTPPLGGAVRIVAGLLGLVTPSLSWLVIGARYRRGRWSAMGMGWLLSAATVLVVMSALLSLETLAVGLVTRPNLGP